MNIEQPHTVNLGFQQFHIFKCNSHKITFFFEEKKTEPKKDKLYVQDHVISRTTGIYNVCLFSEHSFSFPTLKYFCVLNKLNRGKLV